MRLSVKAFALTCGILWGLAILFGTWWLIWRQGVTDPPQITVVGKFYIGYSVSWGGSFIGLIWGFVDGLVAGGIFAWLYNLLAARLAAPAKTEAPTT
jgi:hypothetical protein